VRQHNEDSFLCLAFDVRELALLGKMGDATLERQDFVFAVSDGMGGASAGEFASRVAVEKITRLLPRSHRHAASGFDAGHAEILDQLFAEIHEALMRLGASYSECRGMGATLTMAWVTPGWLHFAHIGDSRIYYAPARGGMRQLTDDHSHVGWLQRTGRMTEREARAHPARSSLQKALGADNQFVDPQVGAVGIEPGDRFLLCTDGVVDGLFDSAISRLLSVTEASQAPEARDIVAAAVASSGRDNTTAVVLEFA
jgi:protein phosphatase